MIFESNRKKRWKSAVLRKRSCLKDLILDSDVHCNSHIMIYLYDILGMNETIYSKIMAKKIR